MKTILLYSPNLGLLNRQDINKQLYRLKKEGWTIEKYQTENLLVPELLTKENHIVGLTNIINHLKSL